MNQLTPKQPARRGRIFPELTLPPEELAKREAEREVFTMLLQPLNPRNLATVLGR